MEVVKSWRRFRLSHGGGQLRSHRDTMVSYVSRGRGSIVSNSISDAEHRDRKTSDTELKPLTPKIISNDANENHKTNGHVHIQDESQPMITEHSNNTYFNNKQGPND